MLFRRNISIALIMIAIISIACTSAPASQPQIEPTPRPQAAAPQPTESPTPVPEDTPTSAPVPQVSDVPTGTPTPRSSANSSGDTSNVANAPSRLTRGWRNTDFSKHSVEFVEIISGGVPRDGIPPIDSPLFLDVSETPDYMGDSDPVIALEIDSEAKAYPLDILQGHEIVNDELNGIPVTITYCPLCNTAIVFDRRLDDRVFDFGVSGNLRNSDLIMWDRQTESWWQQVTGEAIVGEMTGSQLVVIPAPVISWSDFRDSFPNGQLLSRDTGRPRNYDNAPYDGYDALNNETPFLFIDADDLEGVRGGEDPELVIKRKLDDRLVPMERVVSLTVDGQAVAYPFSLMEQIPVINDTVGSQEIVVFYVGGTLSAFEGEQGASNRIVGSTGVYEPFVDGERLSFTSQDGAVVDEFTGSKWNILGKAIEGPLEGTQLTPVAHANHFWFAWAAFHPDTELRQASDFGG